MKANDYAELIADIKAALASSWRSSFGILGNTPTTYDLLSFFNSAGIQGRLVGIYVRDPVRQGPLWKTFDDLAADRPDFVIIADDVQKEDLIEEAIPFLDPSSAILLAGYGHFEFRDQAFHDIVGTCLVPSLANGYPETLIHLYQCLQNASRLGLQGVVAEFGMYKGGTTMALAKLISYLGSEWRILGFDTFAGFPARRSALDMYAHPGCVFNDEAAVAQYLSGANVEIISGDIVDTISRLDHENIVVAFLDTDNYTPATAVLDVIQDRVLPGGSIVLDHFTGRDRFRYTLGERLAAKRLLNDKRYFHLQSTGVFLRQC